jgi:SAM-dependent methyltransferase
MQFLTRCASFFARALGMPPSSRVPVRTRQIRTMEQFFRAARVSPPTASARVSVDLGSGSEPRNPLGCERLYGLDIAAYPGANVMAVDLFQSRLPFPDDSVDVVTAYDFLEHVPRCSLAEGRTRFPFVDLMSEVFRILKPGGLFFSKTPAYPSAGAFVDPTHVNILTEDTFLLYFCTNAGRPQASRYGFQGDFTLVSQRWWGRGQSASLLSLLQKPSSPP